MVRMAFMEWRRFNFFDLSKNVDGEKISETLKGAQVCASSSGHGHLVFGDSEGHIHLVNRMFEMSTFRAHEVKVSLIHHIQNSSLLVTIGEDESLISCLKVWDTEKKDKQGMPLCLRTSRLQTASKNATATALAVFQNHLLAVGFTDGSVLLQRGEVGRERSLKQVVLREGSHAVSGLAFRVTARASFLFVATTGSVLLYNITTKDKEQRSLLDSIGCEINCCVATDCIPECNFMIGRPDAIYCYTTEGRGPCYAIEGKKKLLQISRTYLVVVAEDQKAASNSENALPSETVTVLDLQNKFLVFSAPTREAQAVLSEWGYFLLLSAGNNLLGLAEKDLQAKLSMLFKKNLYDVAIRIAKSHQYDAEGLSEIFRQYGDHLYSKGDHSGAIEQYIKTIEKIEPSYVIRKFLDSQLIEHLTTYLQALHKQGLAGEDHTTLLLNCYTKLNKTEKLKEFLMTKDRELDFDVDTAIRVCRQVSLEDALTLAKKHRRHEWYLKLQLEDKQEYEEVLEYISNLPFSDAEANLKKCGSILLQHAPQQTTDLLKRLCTDYRPNEQPLIDQRELDGSRLPADKANPEEFIHLFLDNSEMLVQFLENVIQVDPHASSLVYNTLMEHYLQVWEQSNQVERPTVGQKVLRMLQNPDSNYDRAQTLILCQLYHFAEGLLFLYEEAKMYQHMMRFHASNKDYGGLVACCRKFGSQEPTLWVQALAACSKDAATPSTVLSEVLQVIERERLLPPLLVIDALASSSNARLGDVRSYLLGVLRAEEELTKQEQVLIEKYSAETKAIRQQIRAIETSNVIFRANLCNACNQHLELPSVHFLCQHSFHQHCFQSCAESDHECPLCLPNNKKIIDIIKSQEQSRSLHESFHSQLERAQDGFSLVADYFGRGVFNHGVPVTPGVNKRQKEETVPDSHGFEDRNQLLERPAPKNVSSSLNSRYESWSGQKVAKAPPAVPSSQRYESWAGTATPAVAAPRRSPQPQSGKQMAKSLQTHAINPFDESPDYDQAKNPFADEDEVAVEATSREATPKKAAPSVNPFDDEDEGDDYDKNLNPFGES